MNRKAALFISVILLTQVASYSFNEITPQIDWEEPFQGDSSWEATGRTGCGSDYTNTSISTHTNSTTYIFGDDPELIFTIDCAIVGVEYHLQYKVWGWSDVGQADWLGGLVQFNFTATATNVVGATNTITLYETVNNLNADNYSVNVSLWNTSYDPNGVSYSGSTQNMPNDAAANFTVTDCGYDESLTTITALTFNWDIASEWAYTNLTLTNMSYSGNAYCLIPGQYYSVNYQITNHSDPNYFYEYEYHNFTAINTAHHWYHWDMVFPAGNYTTMTYFAKTNQSTPSMSYAQIAQIQNDFMVVDNSTGWFNVTPGNNSSGNNTGPMESLAAWTNNANYSSSDDIDLMWNATDLVWDMSINYNVTVDVYGYNMATNTTSIVWSDSSVFSSTTEWFHDGFTINAGTLSTGCYYASFDLHDADDGMFFDNDGFEFGVNMDCSSTGGNNDSWESIEGSGNADLWWNSSDIISFDWNAFDLVGNMSVDYNVTVNVYGYNMTTNTSSIVYTNSTVFSPTTNWASGFFSIIPNTLPGGCYFASFLLFDNVDGMTFDQDGFEFGVNADCSNSSSTTMEWLDAWSALDEYEVGDDVIINWTAHDLVWNESINYTVTIDVYDTNPMTNTTGLVYSSQDVFSPASDVTSGWFTITSDTGDDGCYYAKLELLDWDDGMQFDYAYVEFSIGEEIEDCDFDDQNNTGGNNSNDCPENFIDLDAWTEWYTHDLADDPEVELTFVVSCADNGILYSLDYHITDSVSGTGVLFSGMQNWTGTGNVEEWFADALEASDLGVGEYYLNATLYQTDCWSCPQTITYVDSAGQEFEVIDTSGPEYEIWSLDQDDCTPSGEDFKARILVYAGPNEPHTVNWSIWDENGVVTSWHAQDMTTSANGSAIFDWALDTTNLSDGLYSIQLQDPGSGFNLTKFYFKIGCTGCGYDSSLTELNYQIWSDTFGTIFSSWNESEDGTATGSSSNSVNDDTPQIIAGTELGFWGQIECLEFEQDYLLNYSVTSSANTWVMGEEQYFNSGSSTWYWFEEYDIPTTLLPAGEYCITVTLYVSPYGGSDVIFTFTECVEIVPIEDWDGCGSNLTYLEHLQTVSGNPFVQQDTVFLTTSNIWVNNFVDCLVIGENYTMVTDVTSDGSPYLQFSDSFTVNQFSDITQWDWQTISDWQNDIDAGNYCVETTIHSTDATFTQQIALVSTITDCFAVVNATIDDWWDNQDNGTGNGSGTPNDPVLPDTNCSDLNGTLSGLNLTNAWNESDCENGTGFWFNLTVNGTGITWYDPIYAVGYDYEVISGPQFSSVVVPPGYGDDKYDLYLWDGTEYVLAASDLDALTEYWFTDDGGVSTTPGDFDGISKFSIRGLEISEKLDPDDPDAFVTGLSFVQDPNEIGEVILSMNPIRASDEDDDGVRDENDNCVNTENTDQADSDGDGVGDACEENLSTGDLDDDDGDDSSSDSGSSMTTIFAMLAVGLVFVVLFMRGGDDDDESPPQSGKKYYPFDNSN